MRRGKHAPKHINIDRNAPHTNISRIKLSSFCQVVTTRGQVCGAPAPFTGRSMRPTNPPTPRVNTDICEHHARTMRDLYGYNITLKQGEYALLA